MCIGIIRNNSLVDGRARAESNPGHWARHALLHMATECVNHKATKVGCRTYLPSCKISSKSDKGFRFCACAITRIKLITRLFYSFFGFFKSSTANTPARILTQNTSKNAVLRKDAPFWGSKNEQLSFSPPFVLRIVIMGSFFDGTEIFARRRL